MVVPSWRATAFWVRAVSGSVGIDDEDQVTLVDSIMRVELGSSLISNSQGNGGALLACNSLLGQGSFTGDANDWEVKHVSVCGVNGARQTTSSGKEGFIHKLGSVRGSGGLQGGLS